MAENNNSRRVTNEIKGAYDTGHYDGVTRTTGSPGSMGTRTSGNRGSYEAGVDHAKEGGDLSTLSIKLDVDCSEALTGLKAIQREAKKATRAVAELESVNGLAKIDLTGGNISLTSNLGSAENPDECGEDTRYKFEYTPITAKELVSEERPKGTAEYFWEKARDLSNRTTEELTEELAKRAENTDSVVKDVRRYLDNITEPLLRYYEYIDEQYGLKPTDNPEEELREISDFLVRNDLTLCIYANHPEEGKDGLEYGKDTTVILRFTDKESTANEC